MFSGGILMNMVNEKVEHIIFGSGVITEIYDNKVIVQFKDNIGTKKFIYPDAFEKFLKAVDQIVQDNIMEEYYKKRMQIELERSLLEKEREDAEKERKMVNRKAATSTRKKKSAS